MPMPRGCLNWCIFGWAAFETARVAEARALFLGGCDLLIPVQVAEDSDRTMPRRKIVRAAASALDEIAVALRAAPDQR